MLPAVVWSFSFSIMGWPRPSPAIRSPPGPATAAGETVVESVPDRLAGLHHAHDSFLGLGMIEQFHEGAPLQVEQPLFVDQAARLDIAAAHDLGDHHA